MTVAAHDLQDVPCSVEVLEALRPVSALMIVKTEVGIAVGQLVGIVAMDLLLDYDALCL